MSGDTKTPASVALGEHDPDGWGEIIVCPVCGYDYVHVGLVRELVDGKTTRTFIGFNGECGHKWDLVLVDHKGNAFAHLDNAVEEHPAEMRTVAGANRAK
jgi:hypothetical protein